MDSNSAMVQGLISNGTLKSAVIIDAFMATDRRDFVTEGMSSIAYEDEPLPIGMGQTISQPSTVAMMTEALDPGIGMKILEIGTGSGYQAAILSRIVGDSGKVITIERLEKLFENAKKSLGGYKNVSVVHADGSLGCEREAPFDRIIVTAASPGIPEPLKAQLADGGKLLIPVGKYSQQMTLVTKTQGGFRQEILGDFLFVPLIGRHGFGEE